jgi:hypothetical protein
MRSVSSWLAALLGGVVLSASAPAAPAEKAGTVASWLEEHPAVKKHVVWTAGNGKRQPFDQWTPAQKARIEGFYHKFVQGERDLKMHLPTAANFNPDNWQAYFTAEQAFDVYAAHVAHVIYVEARRLVPWSIQERPGAELDALLAGAGYVARIGPSTGNTYPAGIQSGRDFTEAPENTGLGELNGDPRAGYDFVSGKTSASHKRLIGANELETLKNLTIWLRDNIWHGSIDEKMVERAKAQRWLEDRLRPERGGRTAVLAKGCHSASKLMVDLARSVNLPLLHARALDNMASDDTKAHFLRRTHGGLVYGWGGSKPRILWHTDEVYANAGKICFPLDPKTGALAGPELAAQLYFDELWATPAALRKAGFVYRLHHVLPGKGYGVATRGPYEDRVDFGMMTGCWSKKGKSDLSGIYLLNHDYVLGGAPFLQLGVMKVAATQWTLKFKDWQGDFPDAEVPFKRPVKDYVDRAAVFIKALGGPDKLPGLIKQAQINQGKDLLAPH